MALNPMISVHKETEKGERGEGQGKTALCDKPKNADQIPEAGGSKVSSRASRGSAYLLTLEFQTFNFQNCRKIHSIIKQTAGSTAIKTTYSQPVPLLALSKNNDSSIHC